MGISLQEKMFAQSKNKEIFEQAKLYAYEYMECVYERNVYPSDKAIQSLKIFDESFPENSSKPEEILQMLHEYGSPATLAQTGGRYFGFVNGSSVPISLAAKWLSDVWDQNTALYVMSPLVSQLENTCEKWLVELLGLPTKTVAGFVSGTSTATLCGIAAGRNELLKRQKWDVNADGLFGAPKIRVIVGAQAHATVFKALALLGLGKERVEIVPVDNQGRMIVEKMPKLDPQSLVIIQAGNVNTGAFDPINEICNQSNNAGAWVHIDGAFGLWAAGTQTKKFLTFGIEKADSWSVDAHKTLNAPYDCGIILCKHRESLISAVQASASYIIYSDKRDGMYYTPEMSRRARVVELWATLKYLGKDGIEEIINRICNHATSFAKLLENEGFHILNDVVFNQVLVSCENPEQTKATLNNIQKSGICWCGSSVWNGEPAIRISVCSWATTIEDVNRSVDAFVHARELSDRQI